MELKRLIQDFETKEIGQEENKNMRCNICKKLFVGLEFIRKHLHNKHQDQIGDIIRKVPPTQRIQEIMLENYVNDGDKLTDPLSWAGENYRSFDRKSRPPLMRPRRPPQESNYEDLDDPKKSARSRRVVDYSDI